MTLDYEAGIFNYGNTYRLKKLFEKAGKGGRFTIGFLGGSITQGSLATKPEFCYAHRVFEWWEKTFPDSEFVFVNAGIGATDSQFGVARVKEDLLDHDPDFVVTEFSVNDENNEHFLETYEGLVRKVYSYKSSPALVTMNNVFYDTGRNAEDQHVRIAKYYGLPAVGVRPSLYKAIVDGKIEARSVTSDDLHPNDLGHGYVAEQITYYLEKVKKSAIMDDRDVMLTKPITGNTYENSFRLNRKNFEPLLEGFEADLTAQNGVSDCFKNGWTAGKTGDRITFRVKGTNFSVQYKKAFRHPAPVARLTLDGKKESTILLDANFDETWGDKLFLTTIAEGLEDREHEIVIELTETHKDDTAPFYLAAVLVS